jgi:hypothetical protein
MGWSMGWDDGHTSIHDGGRTFRRVRFEEYRIYDAAGEPYLEPPGDSRKVFLLRGQKLLPETVDVHSTNHFDVTESESMYSSALTQSDQRAARLETCIAEGARLAQIGP